MKGMRRGRNESRGRDRKAGPLGRLGAWSPSKRLVETAETGERPEVLRLSLGTIEPGLGEVQVALNAAEGVIVDGAFIAQRDDHAPLDREGLAL